MMNLEIPYSVAFGLLLGLKDMLYTYLIVKLGLLFFPLWLLNIIKFIVLGHKKFPGQIHLIKKRLFLFRLLPPKLINLGMEVNIRLDEVL